MEIRRERRNPWRPSVACPVRDNNTVSPAQRLNLPVERVDLVPPAPMQEHEGQTCPGVAIINARARNLDKCRLQTRIPLAFRIGVIMRFKFSPRIIRRAASGMSAPITLPNCEPKLRPPTSLP